jgi:DNA-binding transcriptional LysR family regulator
MALLEGIESLTVTVEAGSFANAARRLGLTPSAVSRRVAALELEVGVPLLARTTRSLSLTDDGRAFYERCVRILQELNEARDALTRAGQRPSGILRVDAPAALGRAIIAPSLCHFLARYPDVRVDLTLRDQTVDPVAEGLDVLVRIGRVDDNPNLISRKLGTSQLIHCAAPIYLRKHGIPEHPRELVSHSCIGYLREGRVMPFEFLGPEGTYATDILGPCNANDADVLLQLARAGQGVVALFDFLCREAVTAGTLVRVLTQHPSTTWPIHALYPPNRHLLAKVRVFLDFLVQVFREHESTHLPATSRPRATKKKGRTKRRVTAPSR